MGNDALLRLGKRMGVEDLDQEDWDLIFADAARVAEFCELYDSGNLPEDEKTELMWLIIASLDALLGKEPNSALQSRVESLLKRDRALHKDVIDYWAASKKSMPVWKVTPMIRYVKEIGGQS